MRLAKARGRWYTWEKGGEDLDIFEGLNSAQREAVASTEGYIRVVAGAGSGKTRALARRFAYLVNDLGVTPGSILCVTFTNKSAAEMRQRIRALTGDSDTGHICTFHSFFHIFCKTDLSSRFFRILFALFYQFFIWP